MNAAANCNAANAAISTSVTRAIAILSSHSSFQYRLQHFSFEQADGVLIIEGMVPSFYLKQLLQATLQRLGGIKRVDNRVRVVSCAGLSSVSRKERDYSEVGSAP